MGLRKRRAIPAWSMAAGIAFLFLAIVSYAKIADQRSAHSDYWHVMRRLPLDAALGRLFCLFLTRKKEMGHDSSSHPLDPGFARLRG